MKKPVKPKAGKVALAAALNRWSAGEAKGRSQLSRVVQHLAKLEEILCVVSNEIAAASAAHVAELTALRQEIAACFRPGEEVERRVVRRLPKAERVYHGRPA